MAGRIPQSFIDQLLDRTDIVDVVGRSVKLKKTGRNYSACCPFHQEKTPSFTVSPDKQFYYCFGCGATGNALGFVMAHERLGFVEAIGQLAARAGLEVPREQLSPEAERQQQRQHTLYDQLAAASDWYRGQLKTAPEAIDYLKRRGLSGRTARDYCIGFAPPGWQPLLQALGTDDDTVTRLIEAGLVIDDNGKRYDRFRHRIMFPIRDTRGRVIAFGGRVLGTDKPKYLNSPETAVFHKGRELYGLYEARQAGARTDRLLVVEGYMDVVMLAEHGIRQAVACLGTALTYGHLERLFRHTSEVIFCFDGDAAGLKAAHRALETCLPALHDGRLVRFMFLPDGEDPDSLVQKEGPTRFMDRAAGAESLSAFLFRASSEGLDTRSADGRARFAKQALALIAQTPEGLFRSLLLNELGQLTGLDPTRLEHDLGGQVPASRPATGHGQTAARPLPPERRPLPPAAADHTSLALHAITLLLNQPGLAAQADTAWQAAADSPDEQLLEKLIRHLQAHPQHSAAALLGRVAGAWPDAEERDLITRLATRELLVDSAAARAAEFAGCLPRLRANHRHRERAGRIAAVGDRRPSEMAPEELDGLFRREF